MRQYAFIGLGTFGSIMLERLAESTDQIIVVDKDPILIERVKDKARYAYVADAMHEEALKRILPEALDVAVVDVGGGIEASAIVTNILKKLGVAEIIVKADSEDRGEILRIVGATRVVYPDREAASQIVPMLVSPTLFSFMPISSNLVMAEVKIPETHVGQTLVEANLRQLHGINVIAIRSEDSQEYRFFSPDYRLGGDDVLLLVGRPDEVFKFSGIGPKPARASLSSLFKGFPGRREGKRRP
jgi:trk system potassium uptake protein TrkA